MRKTKKTYAEFWHGVCQNKEEQLIAESISVSMPEISIAEPVCFTGISNGKRNTEKQASLYDCMMAEIMAEREERMRKFMRKHEIRNDGKPVRKEKRKSYRKELCYSSDPWHGWDTIAEFRMAEKIRTDAEDWKIESVEIAEAEEWERFNRELDEFNRQWRMAEEIEMRKFNEWLKWA